MQPALKEHLILMKYSWLAADKLRMYEKCSLIHQNRTCLMEYINKVNSVFNVGVKYYIPFHLIPLLLKFKGMKRVKDIPKVLFEALKKYLCSVLFMVFLVSNIKGGLCYINSKQGSMDGNFLFGNSFIAALSIMFQSQNRKRQIGYYTLSKSIRAMFMNIKRARVFESADEGVFMMTVLIGVYYWIFSHFQSTLKQKSIVGFVWGDND